MPAKQKATQARFHGAGLTQGEPCLFGSDMQGWIQATGASRKYPFSMKSVQKSKQ